MECHQPPSESLGVVNKVELGRSQAKLTMRAETYELQHDVIRRAVNQH
jgi:hypothetical protein